MATRRTVEDLAKSVQFRGPLSRTIGLMGYRSNNELNGQDQPDDGEVNVKEVQLDQFISGARTEPSTSKPYSGTASVQRPGARVLAEEVVQPVEVFSDGNAPQRSRQDRKHFIVCQQVALMDTLSAEDTPILCERSVRYHNVQYSTSGWPKVSMTKRIQNMAIDFFRVRSE